LGVIIILRKVLKVKHSSVEELQPRNRIKLSTVEKLQVHMDRKML